MDGITVFEVEARNIEAHYKSLLDNGVPYRGLGLGKGLTAEMETCAQEKGMKTLYLLTTTAVGYFPRPGFQIIERSSVPGGIAATEEFRKL